MFEKPASSNQFSAPSSPPVANSQKATFGSPPSGPSYNKVFTPSALSEPADEELSTTPEKSPASTVISERRKVGKISSPFLSATESPLVASSALPKTGARVKSIKSHGLVSNSPFKNQITSESRDVSWSKPKSTISESREESINTDEKSSKLTQENISKIGGFSELKSSLNDAKTVLEEEKSNPGSSNASTRSSLSQKELSNVAKLALKISQEESESATTKSEKASSNEIPKVRSRQDRLALLQSAKLGKEKKRSIESSKQIDLKKPVTAETDESFSNELISSFRTFNDVRRTEKESEKTKEDVSMHNSMRSNHSMAQSIVSTTPTAHSNPVEEDPFKNYKFEDDFFKSSEKSFESKNSKEEESLEMLGFGSLDEKEPSASSKGTINTSIRTGLSSVQINENSSKNEQAGLDLQIGEKYFPESSTPVFNEEEDKSDIFDGFESDSKQSVTEDLPETNELVKSDTALLEDIAQNEDTIFEGSDFESTTSSRKSWFKKTKVSTVLKSAAKRLSPRKKSKKVKGEEEEEEAVVVKGEETAPFDADEDIFDGLEDKSLEPEPVKQLKTVKEVRSLEDSKVSQSSSLETSNYTGTIGTETLESASNFEEDEDVKSAFNNVCFDGPGYFFVELGRGIGDLGMKLTSEAGLCNYGTTVPTPKAVDDQNKYTPRGFTEEEKSVMSEWSKKDAESAPNVNTFGSTTQGETVTQSPRSPTSASVVSRTSASITSPTSASVTSPTNSVISTDSITLTNNQRALVEQFAGQLSNYGMEVLKLNRKNQWQLRYFTVSKEQLALTAHEALRPVGEVSQCPEALLWLKKFNPNIGGYNLSNIDKGGHGGMMLANVIDVQVFDSPNLDNVPKKSLDRFKKASLVKMIYTMDGSPRVTDFLCRDSNEAQYLSTCIRVSRDLHKREAILRLRLKDNEV